MAAGVFVIMVQMQSLTGADEDDVLNVWTFDSETTDPSAVDALVIFDRLETFYTTVEAGVGNRSVGSFISNEISRVADSCQMRAYFTTDLDGSTPLGSPVAVRTWELAQAAAGTALPGEVAVVLSFHASLINIPETAPNPLPPPAPAIIRPAARRRGRLYFGPLSTDALTTTANQPSRVSSNCQEVLALRADALEAASDDIEWSVWSKIDAASRPVTGGHIDNAFDTQRRRGVASNFRRLWG